MTKSTTASADSAVLSRLPRTLTPYALAILCAAPVSAQHSDHALGSVDFRISCSPAAQAEFNRAVALLHHMTYPQAQEAFGRVAALDPRCAMAQWGFAMTLFQPLWPTRPSPDMLRRGWAAVEKGKALQPPTKRERLFLATAEAFFEEPASTDYWLRIRRWRQSTERLHAAEPDDVEAGAFHALALLATAPTDTTTKEAADRAASILLRIHEKNPDHPGANHYLVHSSDVTGRERESLAITRRYSTVAPRNPHALHMPTHIYTRLGEWNGVIEGNLRAAEAALEIPAGDQGQFVWDEFPHAIEYLVYGYLQRGQDTEADAQLRRMQATAHRVEPTFKTAFHLASTEARYALERKDWSAAVRITPRQPSFLAWDRFAWPEAIAQFARGMGAAHQGDAAAAMAASARLDSLETSTRKAGEELFARNIQVLRLILNGWRAQAAGQSDSSVALLNAAARLEVATPKHPVTPGPTIPAYELLGDLLLEQKKSREALVAYRRALELYPKRYNSLLGAARAAAASGEAAVARRFFQELVEITDAGSTRPGLAEARRYLSGAR